MSFPNLFTGLPAFGEDIRTQDRSNVTNWNQTDNGKKGRKRKTQAEQFRSNNKRRCYQPKDNTTSDASKYCNTRVQLDQKHQCVNQTKEMINDHKSGYNTRFHKGQKNKNKNNSNVNKQQHWGKRTERNQQQHTNKERRDYKDGRRMSGKGGRTSRDNRQHAQVKTRFMTDEFKEQNAMLVDGQLLCRHFLRGRCIKAGDCQLKHLQPCNDMIKEVCKFYIQGFCTKGESCPYMHKSFPCKFFHRKGKCTQDVDCRFSHEPLNEVTERLLNEAIKRENDLYELAKAKEVPSAQPVSSEESEVTEANRNHNEILQPVRPSFYHSTEAERESSARRTEELEDNKDERGSDAGQPHSPPSADLTQLEPVCYSVEAVLGPQQSRPFPSFFTAPGSQETKSVPAVSQAASDPGSVNQSEVPYSVDAVLRSYKPVSQTYSPPVEQTASYTPKVSSENQNKVSLNIKVKAELPKKKTYKSLPSLQGHPSLIPKTYPDVFLGSGEHKNEGEDVSPRQKNARITSHEVKQGLLNSPVTEAEKSASSPSKRLTELKPSPSGLTSDPQSGRKPLCPSSCTAAAPVESATGSAMTRGTANAAVHHFAVKQFTEIHLNPRRTKPTPKASKLEQDSAKIPPQCPNRVSQGGHFSAGCHKTQTKAVQPASDSVAAPAGPQGFKQPADVTDDASASSFLSLFEEPLGEIPAPLPCFPSHTAPSSTPSCSQASVSDASSNLKESASGLETPIQLLPRPDAKQTSHSSASSRSSCRNENHPEKQICCSDSAKDPSGSGTRQPLPDVASLRDSAAEASSDLKTLFLSLKPYQEERAQQTCSEGERKDGATCDLLKQQEEFRRKKTDFSACHKQSDENEKAGASAEHQLPLHTSLKAAGPSTVGQRGSTKSPERISGTHSFPFKAVMKRPTQRRVKAATKDAGKMAATPFKDLFKALDLSVFPSGR